MTPTRVLTVNDSSNISTIQYDHVTKDMIVEFTNRTRYIYHNVDAPVFGSLASAQSVGELFNRWNSLVKRDFERMK
jgi:hypothetical protein